MQSVINAILEKGGLLGILLALSIALVWYLLHEQKSDREKWRTTIDEQFKNANEVTNRNTQVLHELKAIIQSMDRRLD